MDDFYFPIGTAIVEAGSDKQKINATSHAAKPGDVLIFTTGNRVGMKAWVRAVSANVIITVESFNITCAAGDVVHIYRPGVPKRAFAEINVSSTNATVLAAVSGKRLRCLGLILGDTASSTNITFTTLGAGTAISATFTQLASSFQSWPYNPGGWFESANGEGIGATTGPGGVSRIQISYVEL